MMNITLLALNSKYIHSSLALWYLAAACEDCGNISTLEHSINEPLGCVLRAVYKTQPDFLAISCYIWNIDFVLDLCRELSLLCPDTKIILGGPEATFRAHEIMRAHPYIHAVVLGEGEKVLPALLYGESPCGCIVRDGDALRELGDYQCIADLDSLPSPYTDTMLASLHGKIAYFESSRGCPFSCAYCLSSATHGVRYFSLKRVFRDITRLAASGVQTIKFVDRTFNANLPRTKELISFLLTLDFPVTYHFEVGADLFDDELISLFKSAPSGRFQIEAGIQSTHEPTLSSVCRATDTKKALSVLQTLSSFGNIHVHADLICGLPHEDFKTFAQSFDDLYASNPHALQLGFLKLLHGSLLRDNAKEHGYIASPFPPYEVRQTHCLSVEDIFRLHKISDCVERLHNSGRFAVTLRYLSSVFPSAFYMFDAISEAIDDAPTSAEALFEMLADFCKSRANIDFSRASAALAFDYYSAFKTRILPEFLFEPKDAFFLIEEHKILRFTDLPVKAAAKLVLMKFFPFDMSYPDLPEAKTLYAIHRQKRDLVTGRFISEKIDFNIAL